MRQDSSRVSPSTPMPRCEIPDVPGALRQTRSNSQDPDRMGPDSPGTPGQSKRPAMIQAKAPHIQQMRYSHTTNAQRKKHAGANSKGPAQSFKPHHQLPSLSPRPPTFPEPRQASLQSHSPSRQSLHGSISCTLLASHPDQQLQAH